MTDIQILITVILVVSAIVVGIPLIYVILIPIIKPTISNNLSRYLYAFSSGFFLIIATVLFIGESKTHLSSELETIVPGGEAASMAVLALILTSAILIGLLFSLGIKYFFAKNEGKKIFKDHRHNEENNHSHDHMIFNISDYDPKSKSLAIFFMLTHRLPDGLFIGLMASQIARDGVNVVNIVFLISFVIHVIPEELIIYYRQLEMGISKKKAAFNSFLGDVITIPIIIIGAIVGWFSNQNEIAIHVIQLVAASFLLFISIVEFIPEFLHENKLTGKEWYKTILILILGIGFGIFVVCFHSHETSHGGHDHEHYLNIIKEFQTTILAN